MLVCLGYRSILVSIWRRSVPASSIKHRPSARKHSRRDKLVGLETNCCQPAMPHATSRLSSAAQSPASPGSQVATKASSQQQFPQSIQSPSLSARQTFKYLRLTCKFKQFCCFKAWCRLRLGKTCPRQRFLGRHTLSTRSETKYSSMQSLSQHLCSVRTCSSARYTDKQRF